MAGAVEATRLIIVDTVDGEQWYTFAKLQVTLLQVCAAVRGLPHTKLPPPPAYCRWGSLVKLTPKIMIQLMGAACNQSER